MQYGVVTIDGQQYVERAQIFPYDVNIISPYQILTQLRVTLPGVANFLLKGLTRETTVNGISTAERFKFRLGNSDGATWYISGGIASNTERCLDTLCFGNGMFPFPLIPPIPYSAGSNIIFEVEDLTGLVDVNGVPFSGYTINFAFHGAYLIPVAS
jgi:hypothetical protein